MCIVTIGLAANGAELIFVAADWDATSTSTLRSASVGCTSHSVPTWKRCRVGISLVIVNTRSSERE
jgi:hypothetical protein